MVFFFKFLWPFLNICILFAIYLFKKKLKFLKGWNLFCDEKHFGIHCSQLWNAQPIFLHKISNVSPLCLASELLAGRVNHTLSLTSRCIFSFKKIGWAFQNCEQWISKSFSSQNKFVSFKDTMPCTSGLTFEILFGNLCKIFLRKVQFYCLEHFFYVGIQTVNLMWWMFLDSHY